MPSFTKKGYPWTRQFFESDLRYVPKLKPKVFDAFEKYSGLRGQNLQAAFRSDYIPIVDIKHLPGHYGYTPPTGDEIWLDKTFITELELALPSQNVPRNKRRYSPSELEIRLLMLLEATVLHEMVHFFRRKFDESARINAMSKNGRGTEEAWAREFEQKAYGKRYSVQNLLISKYMPKTAAYSSE
ncbi:MAG: hypothetical protein OEQ14_15450 [Gammaproteobacteria bacterium]|nr:hypothetical protein [Gammaproteobacteria bacterium]